MNKFLISFAFLLLAAGCSVQNTTQTKAPVQLYNYIHQLQVGNKILNVEIANTPAAQAQGLSDRPSLGEDQGMLFEFGPTDSLTPAFWMKDMNFNLDFIWIYQNKIIGITPNVPAPGKINGQIDDTNLPSYYPPSPANQVLEVNAGWAQKNNINIGDQTKILN